MRKTIKRGGKRHNDAHLEGEGFWSRLLNTWVNLAALEWLFGDAKDVGDMGDDLEDLDDNSPKIWDF